MTAREHKAEPIPPVKWLVERTIPFDGTTILLGEPGTGKTWLYYHLAYCVVAGKAFLDRQVQKVGSVLIFDAESVKDEIPRRFESVMNGLGLTDSYDDHIYTCQDELRIDNEENRQYIIERIKETKAEVVVFDPFLKYTDEETDINDSSDMTRFCRCVDEIRDATGCCVIITHHKRKSIKGYDKPKDAMLGSVMIGAGINTLLVIDQPRGDGKVTFKIDKCRAGVVDRTPFKYIFSEKAENCTTFEVLAEEDKTKSSKQNPVESVIKLIEEHGYHDDTNHCGEQFGMIRSKIEEYLKPTSDKQIRDFFSKLTAESEKDSGVIAKDKVGKESFYYIKVDTE